MSYYSFIPVVFLLVTYTTATGQNNDLSVTLAQKVLQANKTGKTFSYNLSKTRAEENVAYYRYLGKIKSKPAPYKILTVKRVWGPNHHTTGMILLFDQMERYIGKYILGDGTDLPQKVKGNALIFTNQLKTSCDPDLVTHISFRDSIPSEIFLKCKGNYGDLYKFIQNK
ncbi:hypothetical protein LL912_19095 [Niabella sp. CC-SYL272]|uniref:hypothetical protein n=1 Tax=Niabella agricola TaxID=2891571 RepID=UPI001F40712C|nr:hypothetical protein [Niabella agricola]MCF3110900.1 hypothetical protein [Niabella agricola]